MSDQKDIFSLDRNLTNNITYINQTYGSDGHLITSLLCYIAWKHRHQLFNIGILDPVEFGIVTGYKAGYLRRKHDSPAQLERMKERDIACLYKLQEASPCDGNVHIFDNILENALYLLFSRSITYPGHHIIYQLSDKEELHKVEVEKITFLKKLKIIWHKSKRGKSKVYYEYELDDSFVFNLSLYYLNCDLSSLVVLRKKRLDTLYLYIKNLREYFIYANKTSDSVSFQTLCMVAQINRSDTRMRKQDLIHAFRTLSEFANFEIILSFAPVDESGYYIPIITFPDVTKPSQDFLIYERQHILYLNFMRILSDKFKSLHDYFFYKDEDVFEVLMNFIHECSKQEIFDIYSNAQIQTFKKLSDKAPAKFEEFYLKLLKANKPLKLYHLFVIETSTITLAKLKNSYRIVNKVSEEYQKQLGWRFHLSEFAEKENYKIFYIGNDIYLCK